MKFGRVLPLVTSDGEVLGKVNEDVARELLRRRQVTLQWGKRGVIALLVIPRAGEQIQAEAEEYGSYLRFVWDSPWDLRYQSPFEHDPPMRPSASITAWISDRQAIRMQSREHKREPKSSRLRAAA